MRQNIKFTSFDWIIFGFILHSIGGMFFNSSKVICYTLCGLGLVIIFTNAFFQMQNIMPFKGSILSLFILYLFWSLFIIVRPFFSSEPFNLDGFSLINPFTWLSFTIPLIVFLGFKNISLRSIFKFSYILGIIGIILLILFYRDIFTIDKNFDSDEYQEFIGIASIPVNFLSISSFMVLFYAFIPTKNRTIAFLSLLLSLLTVLISARRSAVFMYLLIFLLVFYLHVFHSKKGSIFLKFSFVAVIIALSISIFITYANSTFSFFLSRMDEDTRSGVVEYFFESFKGNTLDWIIGRGINGTYHCPIFDNPNRGVIETGYLNIILKGGLIHLALYLFFLTHSAYLGLFKTKNMLTKAMALYLIAHIAFLIPWGLPAFNFEYIILWISIMYCQSIKFRTYTNFEIKRFLSFH